MINGVNVITFFSLTFCSNISLCTSNMGYTENILTTSCNINFLPNSRTLRRKTSPSEPFSTHISKKIISCVFTSLRKTDL